MRQTPTCFSFLLTGLLATLCIAAPLAAQTSAVPNLAQPTEAEQIESLLKHVDTAIDVNSRRFLIGDGAQPHSPWQIFHGILALRQDFQVKVGEQKVSAIQWIATAETKFDNEPLIQITPNGANFHPFTRPYAFQGHPGQFLALLTQSNLPIDYKFRAQGQMVTISHMLRDTMMNVNSQEEVTWVLWALNHYLKSDARWANKNGEQWSIERLVQVEGAAVVENAACGGNHGLFALSRARDKYLKSGQQKLRGVWLVADQKINRYAEIARSLQNSDGSFSSDFYKGRQISQDINTRLNSTGHTLEFLAASLPEKRLKEPWVRNGVYALSKDLFENRHRAVDCGPLYHSLNALMIYRERLQAEMVPQTVLKPTVQPASGVPSVAPPRQLPPMLIEAPVSALRPANQP